MRRKIQFACWVSIRLLLPEPRFPVRGRSGESWAIAKNVIHIPGDFGRDLEAIVRRHVEPLNPPAWD
jgi:hypothetical protein